MNALKSMLLISVLVFVLSACGSSTKKETVTISITPEATTATKPDVPKSNVSNSEKEWVGKIKEIAKKQKTETEKYDEVTVFARSYKPYKEEVKSFETYIKNEFTTKKYLMNTKNDIYMLTNIFKSTVVERFYDDKEMKPVDKFALDFLQNTKYTYRGADTVDSDSVKSNEKQMEKSLSQIK